MEYVASVIFTKDIEKATFIFVCENNQCKGFYRQRIAVIQGSMVNICSVIISCYPEIIGSVTITNNLK